MAVATLKFIPLSFIGAKNMVDAFAIKRGVNKGKVKMANNTWLVKVDPKTYSVVYHSTRIASVSDSEGKPRSIEIYSGGYDTVTTTGRLHQILGAWWQNRSGLADTGENYLAGHLGLVRRGGVSRIRFAPASKSETAYEWDYDPCKVYSIQVCSNPSTGKKFPLVLVNVDGQWVSVAGKPNYN